ncbi:MAG: hypothetical protein BWK80_08895 [Desulfobacteraceae bacterium IS3]|nr:MAG: hypothetical protein BWK80_08895 [Desulfobacteraceae bacterium IS3]
MKDTFEVLIADRNPHVREFLKRELKAEGYRIRLAENGSEVLKAVYQHETLDLLILDPDLPDAEESRLLKKIQNRIPCLPVVIHTFLSDYTSETFRAAALVEKKGNSVELLKQVVSDILKKRTAENISPLLPEADDAAKRIW